MSLQLNWRNSGNGTRTGSTAANLFADLKALVDSHSADPNYLWEVLDSSVAATPFYLFFGLKSGAPGRILLLMFTSSPAANNAAILDTTPTNNNLQVAWFPNGNAGTVSNLTAASGTISGNDTGAIKCTPGAPLSFIYANSNDVPFYFESQEGIFFGMGNTASNTVYGCAAGKVVVDGNDDAQDSCVGFSANAVSSIGNGNNAPIAYTPTAANAGGTLAVVRTNYGAANAPYFMAYSQAGSWASQTTNTASPLVDTSAQRAWFLAIQLLRQAAKGGGFALKLRQMALGPPGPAGAFPTYNTALLTPAAQCLFARSSGGVNNSTSLWLTNFKV